MCDTGMEFPGMYSHIERVKEFIQRDITVIKRNETYEYFLGNHVKRNGKVGYGHPDFRNRWCTQLLKKIPFAQHIKKYDNVVEYHGIAKDEEQRTHKNKESNRVIKYPLVDWGITEAEALQYCYDKGFDWDGLYKDFARVSCWCCPLSRLGELKVLYFKYPELWAKLKEMDKKSFRRFRSDYSVDELEIKFLRENK
jgi:3'-phosphoadenosine 5'-phosphosulfate sulfotransferase (PAPS reductase)/FAD synthetase